MRHLRKGRKFGREKNQRKAFIKGLVTALVLKEKIRTTEARAKEIKSACDKLITLGKKKNLAAYRDLLARLPWAPAKKIFDELALRFKDRKGGYSRIIKLAPRKNDAARMAIIELLK